MAFNFPTATQDFGYGIGESEEERKRREEQERIQREQAAALKAQQDAEAEAQRQRDQQEAKAREQAATAANPTQTVAQVPPGIANPNPYGASIAQGSTVEGPPPTQGGPVAPEQINIEQQRRLQQAQVAAAQPPAAPVAPEQVAAAQQQEMQQRAEQQRAEQQRAAQAAQPPAMPPMPQPGPGVQVAGPTQMPPAPQQQVTPPNSAPAQAVATNRQIPGVTMEQAPTFESRFTDASNDVNKLMALRNDETLSKEQKLLAGRQAQELLNRELGPVKGKEELANMSEAQIGQLLKSKSEEGSWAKLLLLGFVSPTLAAKEAAKLGLNDQWTVGQDGQGNSVLLKTRDGVPVEGISGTTGKALSPKELISAAGQQMGKHVSTAAETYIDPQGNRYQRQADEKGNIRLVNIATGSRFTGDSSKLQRQLDVSSMARVDYGLATDLLKKHSGNVLDMMKEYEMIKGAMTPEARTEFLQRYGYGTTVPGGKAPTQMPTAVPGAPAQIPPAQQPGRVAPAQIPPAQQPGRVAPAQAVAPVPPVQQQAAPAQAVVPSGVGGGRVPGGVSTAGIAGMKAAQDIGVAAAKENIQVQGARSKAFNDILDTEVRPQAQAGDTVSSIRKQQFAIFDRPGIDANKIFGLYTAAQESPGDQKLSIVRDIFGGVFKPEAEVSQRLAQLNLTPAEKSALEEYNISNQQINAATLKRTAGAGSVSDAEQQANRKSNVDPTKIPALGAYNAMAQSQFDADKARWKADWATTSTATNALQLDKEWRKESQRLSKLYQDVATQRIKFINDNGNTYNAVKEGYRKFPVPEYDPNSGTWKKLKPLGAILGGQ